MRWRAVTAVVLVGLLVAVVVTVRSTQSAAAVGKARIIDSSIRTPDGRHRTYRVYVPANLPAHPAPLLIALHGGTGSNTQFERNSGFDALAERFGFIVVYPNGVGTGVNEASLRTWNAGMCCGPAVQKRVDDVGFIRQLIGTIEVGFPIDRTRVFAAGHSNGGFMAYRLACELSDHIAAVGIQSGGFGLLKCAPAHPVSLLHIHGTADTNVPIDGGIGSTSLSKVVFPSAYWSTRTVAAAMHCSVWPTVVIDAKNPDLTIRTRTNAAAHVEVRLIAVRGASHTWMGHRPVNPYAPPAYMRFDSSLAIVQFLLSHPRRS
jgi:polyhydroxybutyrate depolymerase